MLDTDTVRAVLHFFCLFCSCEHLFLLLSSHGGFLFLASSWEHFPSVVWTTPSLVFSHSMSHYDNGQTVAAAAPSQVKLCPYDEEELAVWIRLLEAQFAAAGIKSQKLRYGNALSSLPKQVLRDILDIVNVCKESEQPFDLSKEVLLGQFGKSKWQSYFVLLRLPMEMQGLKPSVLMGKLEATSSSWCQP